MSVVHGDCLDVMAAMEPESVDAIVTDPPYDLVSTERRFQTRGDRDGRGEARPRSFSGGFMGKRWDGTGIAFRPETWAAALRVAKPSAYLLAFGGTRTVHRMAVAIEDAGWIIRDMLVWAYASGFPKSKASLKPAWEPIVMARKPGPLRELAIDACRIAAEPYSYPNGPKGNVDPTSINPGRRLDPVDSHPAGRWPANVILTDPIFDGDVGGVVGGGETSIAPPGRWTSAHADAATFPIDRGGTVPTYGDGGTYSRFFLVPKASRSDREPVLDPYCYCETVKLRTWQRQARNQPDQTANTSPERATSEATSEADSDSSTTLFGSSISAPSPLDNRSTTSTATSSTTESTTSSPSIASPTNGSTPVASSSPEPGGSDAVSAASTESSSSPTGISAERAGLSTGAVAPATFARSSRPSVCARCGKEVVPDRRERINAHPT